MKQAIRLHWGVENGLHWTLDVTFSEDACRVLTGHAPQNLALLRRIALNPNINEKKRYTNKYETKDRIFIISSNSADIFESIASFNPKSFSVILIDVF